MILKVSKKELKMRQKPKMIVRNNAQIVGTSRRGKPIYSDNPFLSRFILSTKPKSLTIAGNLDVIAHHTGEKVGEGSITQYTQVDEQEFIKVYTTNIKHMFSLSSAGSRMLAVLLKVVQLEAIGKDEVLFTYPIVAKVFKEVSGRALSKPTYYRSIDELMEYSFIAESSRSPGIYYINPALIFNGDRVRFIKEYQLKPRFQQTKKELENQIDVMPTTEK
jgi:hypothetical protein